MSVKVFNQFFFLLLSFRSFLYAVDNHLHHTCLLQIFSSGLASPEKFMFYGNEDMIGHVTCYLHIRNVLKTSQWVIVYLPVYIFLRFDAC